MKSPNKKVDLFVVGGGINGAGIARDASGRGYSVALAEMNDFASATSSSSTKLFHGGLRYLEYFKFRLVREALIERETLLRAMPHISWPMRFVLPTHHDMRFESATPTSKLMSVLMPWMKGRRPRWLIRLGLLLYDNLGGRAILSATGTLDLRKTPEGLPLKTKYEHAFEYSDCWVEDARLTLLNVKDAQNSGADVYPRTKVTKITPDGNGWIVDLEHFNGATSSVLAKMVVNAAGPWVADIIHDKAGLDTTEKVRLVRGSHIVTKRLFEHDKSYFFQGTDGRIMFAIPYEEDFTLIGTTDVEHTDLSLRPYCTDGEAEYMIEFINAYLKELISQDDIVYRYAGVRPLYDDGSSSASAATRDYVLKVNTSRGAPILNVFGGKITTYRKLAENALEKIDDALGQDTSSWTASAPLPGGEFVYSDVEILRENLAKLLPFVDGFTVRRLIRQYGTFAQKIFANVHGEQDMGTHFGHGIYALEVAWAIENEWVYTAEDFLWRRSKMGLRFSAEDVNLLENFITSIRKPKSEFSPHAVSAE